MTGQALFVEPLKVRGEDERWYVVIMEGGDHFYYDRATGSRCWQLSDIGFNEDFELDFDKIAMYLAMARGLKWGVEKPKIETETKPLKKEAVVEEEGDGNSDNNDNSEFEDVSEEEGENTLQHSNTNDELVMELLRLEGYIEEKKELSTTLVEGYSSSEDGDSEYESNADHNVGSDNEGNNRDNEDATSQFLALLDEYSDEIDIFSTWAMVEGDLLAKWVTRPEYYAISDAHQKEAAFDQWVIAKTKTSTTKTAVNTKSDDPGGIAATPSTGNELKIPTPRMEYLRFLLGEKKDVKRVTFAEFFNRHRQQEWGLLLGDQKSTYLAYKLMLSDQETFERLEKHKFPDQNMKTLALGRWLALQNLPRHPKSAWSFGSESAFEQWVQVVRTLRLPRKLVEHPLNYVVGDEKRLHCYMAVVSDNNDSGT